MSCEELQQALSSYLDDQLALPARAVADEHLRRCPVCRAQLAELRAITRGLSQLQRPAPPADMAASISYALMIEGAARARQPQLPFSERLALWLRPRLMPYSIGTVASLILFVVMLTSLRASMTTFRDFDRAWRESDQIAIYNIRVRSGGGYDLTKPVAPDVFAAIRARDKVAVESPSLNPNGALAALTRSKSSAQGEDDDMIVVTDVFSNGKASLAGVVYPPRDRRMLDEFQAALRQNAAFVPAAYDRRPETMRVVFVVQKVAVREREF